MKEQGSGLISTSLDSKGRLTTTSNKPSLVTQEKVLRKAAKKLRHKVVPDSRLSDTPYAMMHPAAGKELDQPYRPGSITYDPELYNPEDPTRRRRTPRKQRLFVRDLRHEVVEVVEMRPPKNRKYKKGHKKSNRLQRTIGGAPGEVYD